MRKYYVDQGFKEVDIYVFKLPGTVACSYTGDRCTPKEHPNVKRVLISVLDGREEIERGQGFENKEVFAEMRKKYEGV
jgi:hypothetical protein